MYKKHAPSNNRNFRYFSRYPSNSSYPKYPSFRSADRYYNQSGYDSSSSDSDELPARVKRDPAVKPVADLRKALPVPKDEQEDSGSEESGFESHSGYDSASSEECDSDLDYRRFLVDEPSVKSKGSTRPMETESTSLSTSKTSKGKEPQEEDQELTEGVSDEEESDSQTRTVELEPYEVNIHFVDLLRLGHALSANLEVQASDNDAPIEPYLHLKLQNNNILTIINFRVMLYSHFENYLKNFTLLPNKPTFESMSDPNDTQDHFRVEFYDACFEDFYVYDTFESRTHFRVSKALHIAANVPFQTVDLPSDLTDLLKAA